MITADQVQRFDLPQWGYDPGIGKRSPRPSICPLHLSQEDLEANKTMTDLLAAFLDDPAVAEVSGIAIGQWVYGPGEEDPQWIVEALARAREKLPRLRALILGDLADMGQATSWRRLGDVGALLQAYPELEHLRVRGGDNLSVGVLNHQSLKSLGIKSNSHRGKFIQELSAAQLPRLERLELWLGTAPYEAGAQDLDYDPERVIADLQPILSCKPAPRLRYLGLHDGEMADRLAAAVAKAPLLQCLEVLDFSVGNLSDAGAAVLLASPTTARLKELDIHHHYVSEEAVARLKALVPKVDASEADPVDLYEDAEGRLHR
jgi:hypothetical protein